MCKNAKRDYCGKLSRWKLRLQEYDFIINHVPGNENVLANYLSRTHKDGYLLDVIFGVNTVESDLGRLVCCQ